MDKETLHWTVFVILILALCLFGASKLKPQVEQKECLKTLSKQR